MIYFDALTKAELVNKFYNWTAPGGYLFIGHSESISWHQYPVYLYPACDLSEKELTPMPDLSFSKKIRLLIVDDLSSSAPF